MRLAAETSPTPRWLWLTVGALGAAGLALLRWRPEVLAVLVPGFGRCPLRDLTGVPCPSCGGTRAALHLGGGDLAAAFAANPLVTATLVTVALGAGSAAVATLVPAWRRRIDLGAGRRLLVGFLAVAVAANWLYLIVTGR